MVEMGSTSITIKSFEEKGVLDEITSLISSYGINISYTHLFIEKGDIGFINIELENSDNDIIDSLIKDIESIDAVCSVDVHCSLNDIYGKRVIIFGGGAQVSQVAMGAITEADRHNIRGERISVDTTPLVGEEDISEAVEALSRLPRVSALVLAGSLMGGKIVEAVANVRRSERSGWWLRVF